MQDPQSLIAGTTTPNPGLRSLGSAAARATQLLPGFLVNNWKWVLALHLIGFFAQQYQIYVDEIMSQRMTEDAGVLILIAALTVTFSLIWFSTFFTLMVKSARREVDGASFEVGDALITSLRDLFVENLRVLARVIFWMPFLFFPAIYQYIRLSLVPFIVVDDSSYEHGRVDALDASRQLSRGNTLLLLATLVPYFFLEPLLLSVVTTGDGAFWRDPLGAALSLPVTLVANVWALLFVFFVYRTLSPKVIPTAQSEPTAF